MDKSCGQAEKPLLESLADEQETFNGGIGDAKGILPSCSGGVAGWTVGSPQGTSLVVNHSTQEAVSFEGSSMAAEVEETLETSIRATLQILLYYAAEGKS